MIRLAYASFEQLQDERLYEQALACVNERRRQKTLRLKYREDRMRSLTAELLLMRLLEDAGLPYAEAEITEDSQGKPYLRACPGLHFSLSHSGCYALAAVSTQPVGCDIEQNEEDRSRIAARWFHESEKAWLDEASGSLRVNRFYRIWTLKESYVKAVGSGFRIQPASFGILPYGEAYCCTGLLVGRDWHFAEFTEPAGYAVSVCSDGPVPDTAERFRLEELLTAKRNDGPDCVERSAE